MTDVNISFGDEFLFSFCSIKEGDFFLAGAVSDEDPKMGLFMKLPKENNYNVYCFGTKMFTNFQESVKVRKVEALNIEIILREIQNKKERSC